MQHGVAVGGVNLLGQFDAVVPAVALDLAVVGVQHDLRHRAVVQEWRQCIGEGGQGVVAQRGRIPMQPQPQVMLGIGVAQEEPVVDDAVAAQLADHRPDGVGEDPVSGCGTGVGLEVQPLAARRKGALHLGCAPRLAARARARCGE